MLDISGAFPGALTPRVTAVRSPACHLVVSPGRLRAGHLLDLLRERGSDVEIGAVR